MPKTIFKRLSEFISTKMRMSHIYQPVMIRELLVRGGAASVDEIAASLLAHDPSQVEYYGLRTKNMVGKVLTNNGITEVIKSGRNITGYEIPEAENLNPSERDKLIEACDIAIAKFLRKRGDQIWSHQSTASGYISGTLRYEVLKSAKFRCVLCGTSAEEKALEVDHILPRSQGGSDDEVTLREPAFNPLIPTKTQNTFASQQNAQFLLRSISVLYRKWRKAIECHRELTRSVIMFCSS
jgi:hypothetical protein